jgi:hypothetical protein
MICLGLRGIEFLNKMAGTVRDRRSRFKTETIMTKMATLACQPHGQLYEGSDEAGETDVWTS